MRRVGKKSQASLEYLMIYGFGIIIIVFSLILAWQSGIFTTISPPSKKVGGFSQLTVEDFKAEGNSLTLTIRNNAPDRVKVKETNATLDYKLVCKFKGAVGMAPGDKITLELTCPDLEGKYPSGEYYRANIMIEYLNIRSNHLHQSRGYVWGTVE